MKDTDKIEITVGDLKRGAEKCETARAVLKEMFPKAFEEEWRDITPYVDLAWDVHCGGYDIHLYHEGTEMGWMFPGASIGVTSSGERKNYKIERFNEGGNIFTRILKRVS